MRAGGRCMSVDRRVSNQSDEELQQADAERYGKLMRVIAWLDKLGGRQVTGNFMLGWFVGRTLRRNALRDVDTAQNVMTPDARLAVARRVIAQMVLIERQGDVGNGGCVVQREVRGMGQR